jgi:hypothetical protein
MFGTQHLGLFLATSAQAFVFIKPRAASAVNAPLHAARSSGLLLKRAVGMMFVGLGVRLAVSK